MPTLREASNCCAYYSIVGMIFMAMVFMMLTYQPFFIGGIEDLKQARSNAKGGVGTFLFIFLLSVVYLVFDALRDGPDVGRGESRHSRGVEYSAVPTSGIGGPDLMLETMELPPSAERVFT